ncbi:YdiU family protein [Shewanella sp. NIFS-20-20]|uniref:protein adenylyltransferase SelO n=1 Tax=Shewanella sp. NIFS-20-20 TaxID=2853806 RepID=UPI001C440A63|nr:YdiU family protein [Shewanella sp. NIFS-20-20]MBV7315657.1 YdiU family protein [Shewanella sp. NIFS-20-20]
MKPDALTPDLSFSQPYFTELPQLVSKTQPQGIGASRWLAWSDDAAALLGGLTPTASLLEQCAGNQLLDNGLGHYFAQVYSGHQFGGYSPQLGDGRAMIVGNLNTPQGAYEMSLKGAGTTPYSRHGDGRAVLRSSLREFLASEAMHHLGVATTRALAVVGSDLPVWRESRETAAITVRLARSHIRFGHFEYVTHTRQSKPQLQALLDFTIRQHFPELSGDAAGYKAWFAQVVERTALMIAKWQAYGFTHGVMNTDNMSILGETLDYGPFGFLDTYQESFVCNHSDSEGRYSFVRQPAVALWNLQRLAQALVPIIPSDDLVAGLDSFERLLVDHYVAIMTTRLGITPQETRADLGLISALMLALEENRLDYTNTMRQFSVVSPKDQQAPWQDDCVSAQVMKDWFNAYRRRLADVGDIDDWQAQRRQTNPKFILRNYLAQEAIEAAESGHPQAVAELLSVLQRPFDEQPGQEHYAQAAPNWAQGLVLSCSS